MPRSRTPAPPGHKHCHRCATDRPVENFARDASKSDGLRVCCRACDAKRARAGYWTKERKAARRTRKKLAERRALVRQHGRLWVERQEKLKAEEERTRHQKKLRERREAAKARFFALHRTKQGSYSEEA